MKRLVKKKKKKKIKILTILKKKKIKKKIFRMRTNSKHNILPIL